MNAITTNFQEYAARVRGQRTASETHIVVPCYNEEKRLNASAFLAHLSTSDVKFVFVNDGSRDATLARLNDLQARAADRITVVDLAQNSGKAEAVRQGLLAAIRLGATEVGYWDADLATPLDAIEDFRRVMAKFEDVQVVYGARRMLLGHRIERTLKRRLVSRVCATLARQAVRLPIGDTQCGAKLLRVTPALRLALSQPFTAGWLFDVELFTRLSGRISERRYAFYEQPLAEWDEVAGSKVSTRAIVRSGFQMLRLVAETRLGVKAARIGEGATATILPAVSVADLKKAA